MKHEDSRLDLIEMGKSHAIMVRARMCACNVFAKLSSFVKAVHY